MNNNVSQNPNQVNNQSIQNTQTISSVSVPSANNQQISNVAKKKKGFSLSPLLFIIILLLVGYLFFEKKNFNNLIEKMKYNCTPISSYEEDKELDVSSTLVQDLYKKVHTTIREDYAQPDWDNTMKLYLAYRQIKDYDKYDTNCNMFDNSKMEPYYCEVTSSFKPKAFKVQDLVIEYKNLFGEDSDVVLDNIKLSNACIGGYQYIPEREEYVQGLCEKQTATSFKVDKKLIKAVTNRNTIVLTEEVKYHGNESMDLPDYLKSGNYIYTFRLDVNYNYVLVSKIYDSKY